MSTAKYPTLQEVCELARRLPCSPSLRPRLLSVLESSSSGIDDLEAIIQLDPALATATLRLANSAFFATSSPIETVGEAGVRLGQKELFKLASLALAHRWETGAEVNPYHRAPDDFARHALCVALAAEALAERTGQIAPEVAYTAGLICDVGQLAMAHGCAAFFPAIRARHAKQGGCWVKAERQELGYDHAQLGARLLRNWKLPAAFATAAESYRRPAQAPQETHPLLAVVHAAKFLVLSFGVSVTEEGFLFDLDEDFLRGFRLGRVGLLEVLPMVQERVLARLGENISLVAAID